MVKIAIAGGSGPVAREIIDVLVSRGKGKHEVVVLSRKAPADGEALEGTTWVTVDYEDKSSLVKALQGVDTVLSFIAVHLDPDSSVAKRIIDAAVDAGVKRFAPSEWSASKIDLLPWYAGKGVIRQYLADLNKDKKVIEYTLFQVGAFANYLATPYKTAKYVEPNMTWWDIEKGRVLAIDPPKETVTLTTVKDVANVVALAIEYQGEWPVIGGIQGTTVTSAEVIALGEKLRGKKFTIETLSADDLRAGVWKGSWLPILNMPSITEAERLQFSQFVTGACLLSNLEASWTASDEWNKLLPDYKFANLEEFLTEVWTGKP
ncbi:NmrA-like family protein [Lasiosphaeria ovina]|uniref:NmrA-like family protein n=1 Tax=Lasiosphaeria ovina TaxID=92902 RepID=A0AAE0JTM1_9PEZI|nr:NmrA-like family protein [Lasiosphaeria ovina]